MVKCHATKYPELNSVPRHEDVWGSGGIPQRFLNFGTTWQWSASLSNRFNPGENRLVPI